MLMHSAIIAKCINTRLNMRDKCAGPSGVSELEQLCVESNSEHR